MRLHRLFSSDRLGGTDALSVGVRRRSFKPTMFLGAFETYARAEWSHVATRISANSMRARFRQIAWRTRPRNYESMYRPYARACGPAPVDMSAEAHVRWRAAFRNNASRACSAVVSAQPQARAGVRRTIHRRIGSPMDRVRWRTHARRDRFRRTPADWNTEYGGSVRQAYALPALACVLRQVNAEISDVTERQVRRSSSPRSPR
jgi:hypothetical protein